MSDEAPPMAEVLSADIPNRVIEGGAPFMLLKDAEGRYALAEKVSAEQVKLKSKWIAPQDALDGALMVLTGDKRAITHPEALRSIAIAHVAMWVEAQRKKPAEADR